MFDPTKEKLETFLEKHPKQKELIQFALFSSAAGLCQVTSHLVLDLLLKNVTMDIEIWPFGRQALGTFIAFLISNIIGKTVSYVTNRKTTFQSNTNVTASVAGYVILSVALIIIETIIAAPLQNGIYRMLGGKVNGPELSTLTAENGVLYQICALLSQGIYGTVDWIIVFLMDKYVLMRKK